jgi:hypothetical protein
MFDGNKQQAEAIAASIGDAVFKPRVVVVIEKGKVIEVLAAGSGIECLIVDLDHVNEMPAEAANMLTLNGMTTFSEVRQNDKKMDELFDDLYGHVMA